MVGVGRDISPVPWRVCPAPAPLTAICSLELRDEVPEDNGTPSLGRRGALLTLPSGPCLCSGLIFYTGTAADPSSYHQPQGPENRRPLELLSY